MSAGSGGGWGGGPPARTVQDLRHQQRHQEPPREDDGLPFQAPATIAEVEERIMRADDELTRLTETHVQLADQAARAEARWKNHRDRCITRIVRSGDKGAKDTREAFAKEQECGYPGCPCESDPYAGAKMYEEYEVRLAAKDSSAKAMRSIEARLNAFQTIAANIRKLTAHP